MTNQNKEYLLRLQYFVPSAVNLLFVVVSLQKLYSHLHTCCVVCLLLLPASHSNRVMTKCWQLFGKHQQFKHFAVSFTFSSITSSPNVNI